MGHPCCDGVVAVLVGVFSFWCATASYENLSDLNRFSASRIQAGQCWTEVADLVPTSCYEDAVLKIHHELAENNPFSTVHAEAIKLSSLHWQVRPGLMAQIIEQAFGFSVNVQGLDVAVFDTAVVGIINNFPALADKAQRMQLASTSGRSSSDNLSPRNVRCSTFNVTRTFQADAKDGLQARQEVELLQRLTLGAPTWLQQHYSLVASEILDEYLRTIAPRVAKTGVDLLSLYAVQKGAEHRAQLLQTMHATMDNATAVQQAHHAEVKFKKATGKNTCYWLHDQAYQTLSEAKSASRGAFWTLGLGGLCAMIALLGICLFSGIVCEMFPKPEPKWKTW